MKYIALAAVIALAGSLLVHAWVGPGGRAPGENRIAVMRSELAVKRERQLDILHAYAIAGRYPLRGQRTSMLEPEGVRIPYFIDKRGVACAVGHLMIASGRRDLVDEISGIDLFLDLDHLSAGPAMDWILQSGLTHEECALIQPGYSWRKQPDSEATPEEIADIRAHLLRTEDELRRNSDRALDDAVRRLVARTG